MYLETKKFGVLFRFVADVDEANKKARAYLRSLVEEPVEGPADVYEALKQQTYDDVFAQSDTSFRDVEDCNRPSLWRQLIDQLVGPGAVEAPPSLDLFSVVQNHIDERFGTSSWPARAWFNLYRLLHGLKQPSEDAAYSEREQLLQPFPGVVEAPPALDLFSVVQNPTYVTLDQFKQFKSTLEKLREPGTPQQVIYAFENAMDEYENEKARDRLKYAYQDLCVGDKVHLRDNPAQWRITAIYNELDTREIPHRAEIECTIVNTDRDHDNKVGDTRDVPLEYLSLCEHR